ncbi:MAG: PCMD domain-containing protein, partial [Bacteroidales bacterium]|nr:PCMD domain-containing protein [Bacteroidales bacterium]
DPVDAIETDQWTAFELPFVQKPGKTIDPQKLANGGYSISVVMSSSAGGDFFKGGVNSTLLIDDLEIVSKK